MEQIKTQLSAIMLVGITVRTNNASEMDPSNSKIGATAQQYFYNDLSKQISCRIEPNTTYCAYTDYESDFNGDYTYFIGEKVDSFDDLPSGFVALTIPSQNYIKFTNGPGVMPEVCIDVWKKVWAMNNDELGGKRQYITDFEVYDERASDPTNTMLDVYIGVES